MTVLLRAENRITSWTHAVFVNIPRGFPNLGLEAGNATVLSIVRLDGINFRSKCLFCQQKRTKLRRR